MQAKLPDVNAAIVRYRSQALESVKGNDYSLAIIALAGINADLPEDFKVEISTSKYNDIIKDRKSIECSCTANCILNEIHQYDCELDWKEQILSNQKYQRMWICTACGKSNVMDASKILIKKYQEPFYTKIMPAPPIRARGIRGRSTYESEFKTWFGIALEEIESQISRYRTEYAAQEDQTELIIRDE
jgi:hypothetical protein